MLLNKIFGAILAVGLAILGLAQFSDIIFGKVHHAGHHDEEVNSINDMLASNYSYYVEIADLGGEQGGEEEVFDLGALLAAADPEKGAKSFKSKCSSCHTIDEGGANGTGPNLHDVVGRAIASHAGFGYSSAMKEHAVEDGDWTYANLNDFLTNPKGEVSGTAMAFAGLRKDPERMDVIAYLASVNPAAPAFPAPLPEEPAMDEALEEGGSEASEAAPGVTGDFAESELPAIEGGEDGVKIEVETDQGDALEGALEEGADTEKKASGPHSANNH